MIFTWFQPETLVMRLVAGWKAMMWALLAAVLAQLSQGKVEDVVTDRGLGAKSHHTHQEIAKAMRAIEQVFKGDDAGGCGVIAELKGMHWKPYQGGSSLPCGNKLATNCTISYHQMDCPEECPYLAPELHFPCQFSCQRAADCSTSNVDNAFSDSEYGLCSKCYVTGCAWCDSETSCKRCHHGFYLSQDGKTCIFSITSSGWASAVFYTLLGIIILLLVTAVVYCCRGSRSPNDKENRANLYMALKHRHLSKVQNWDLQSNKKPRVWYPLMVDLAKNNILGVGFALFYRSVFFVLLISVIAAIFLWNTPDSSHLVQSAQGTTDHLLNALMMTEVPKSTLPAVLLSPLEKCPKSSPLDKEEPLKQYAYARAWTLLMLYGAVFLASAWFVRAQKTWTQKFDRKNNTMCDFALLLTGFPADATNEVEMKKWAQEQLKKSGMDVQVEGVSIGYSYGGKADEVDEMTATYCSHLELTMRKDANLSNPDAEEERIRLGKQMEKDGEKVRSWFDKNEVTCSGQIFLCFQLNTDKDKVMEKYESSTSSLFSYKGKEIEVDVVRSEPSDVFWQNLHTTEEEIRHNERKSLAEVAMWFVGINLLVLVWNTTVVMPYLSAGSNAGGPITIIQGIIMTIINGQLGGKVYGGAYGAGYHRKDRADVWLFLVNFFITFCNTIFNLALMCYSVLVMQKENFFHSPGYLDVFNSATPLGQESEVADKVYLLLVPGQLFTGPVNSLLTGAMLNYLLYNLWAKMIYIWKCLPDPGLQFIKLLLPNAPESLDKYGISNAEKAMRAPQIGLPWDYSALILNPFLVFISMCMISENSFKLCAFLALACIFNYLWSKFMHLRVQSVNFYSTGKLDRVVLLAWGGPLSVLGCCSFVWLIRSGHVLNGSPLVVRWGAVFFLYVFACLVWVVVMLMLHPNKPKKDNIESDTPCTFQECKDNWIFSWFNCNPMYALKCLYVIKYRETVWDHPWASGSEPTEVRFYSPGREYLHLSVKNFKKAMEGDISDALEFETWFEQFSSIFYKWEKDGVNISDMSELKPILGSGSEQPLLSVRSPAGS